MVKWPLECFKWPWLHQLTKQHVSVSFVSMDGCHARVPKSYLNLYLFHEIFFLFVTRITKLKYFDFCFCYSHKNNQ